ncbi:zinc-binding alcohol dehydrogenase family protein [Pseudomonas baetica]|uniref:Zinc-type alcohol dehydrogenase-like protein n=1 Tax=Pseudomonas baetica TaxID=674054 RepID=A0ABX4Q8H7_9PSED|nr:zinc-binding alcohol dehydrogenase family protein [Pseudomonas baetica]PKA73091.1 zinc-binding alcohol dehydrogenase family protein [Pseudomonas baetica]PTC18814.1 zinc-binding alcohol dehydrogenase family protein [Pseudomonas baetica]
MKTFTFTPHRLSNDDVDATRPKPGPRQLLIEVHATAVSPGASDMPVAALLQEPNILGWGAAGVVREVGPEATLFQPGDDVFYCYHGSIGDTGGPSPMHSVDERAVGHKPRTLSAARAAALSLPSVTAWELLFERLGVAQDSGAGECLLITGADTDVGSMLVQLARQLTRLTVIACASTHAVDSVRQWGAHHALDHAAIADQLQALTIAEVSYVASLIDTQQHFAQLIDVLRAQGRLAVNDEPQHLDGMHLKRKSLSLHWQMPFTRSLFESADLINQYQLLNRVSTLVDQGVLQTCVSTSADAGAADSMQRAAALLERLKAKGKP